MKIVKVAFYTFLILLILYIVKNSIKWSDVKHKSLYTPTCLTDGQYNNTQTLKKHKKGANFFAQKSVVICGLIRDGAHKINTMKDLVYRVANQFKDYKVLIVENDSIDSTREVLLQWHEADPKVDILGCGVNANKCVLNLKRTEMHLPTSGRIAKMVFLRNAYMEHLSRPEFRNTDFVCVVDLDLKGDIYVDGIWSTGYEFEQNSAIDAICANGLRTINCGLTDWTFYYDSYAHDGGNAQKTDFASHNLNLLSTSFKYGSGLRKIKSGFGGLTFYRYPNLMKHRYTTYPSQRMHPFTKRKFDICEHVALHSNMKNVYLNPDMLFVANNHIFLD